METHGTFPSAPSLSPRFRNCSAAPREQVAFLLVSPRCRCAVTSIGSVPPCLMLGSWTLPGTACDTPLLVGLPWPGWTSALSPN